MNLTYRSAQKELLDGENIPFGDIKQNLQELNTINSWLGGHRITIQGLKALYKQGQPLHVCEIGCGGGDNLQALLTWCNKHKQPVRFTGIDMKDECIQFAKTKPDLQSCTEWFVSDYRDVVFQEKPHIIFSSLFCHHFNNEELAFQLQWMKNHSSAGFFINDLQRHLLAYHAIRILTQLFSKSYLVKNDAPLSVARSFMRKDWQHIFTMAGITSYTIQWQWAFRYLILYRHEE